MALNAEDLFRVDMRVATILDVQEFPEARKPAFVFSLDLGEESPRKSTAQLTAHYSIAELIGKQVIVVVNLEPRQVGPHISECLILGAMDPEGQAIILQPERTLPPGSKVA